MRIFLLLLAGLLVAAPLAQAQTSRAIPVANFVSVCSTHLSALGYASPAPVCACMIGVASGRLDDRQFTMHVRLAAAGMGGDDAGLDQRLTAAENSLRAEGYTDQERSALHRIVEEAIDPLVSSTCGGLLQR